MHATFPQFAPQNLPTADGWSPWLISPWWPADSLAVKRRSLLRILSVAAHERLEAAPLVACLALEHRGIYRRRLRKLAQRLSSRMALADALEQTPGVLPEEQILAIRFGDQSGILPQILAGLLRPERTSPLNLDTKIRQLSVHAITVAATLFIILSFLMIKILPSFQAIFNDFSLELPHLTIRLIELSNLFVNHWYLFALVAIFLYALLVSRRRRNLVSRVLLPRFLRPVTSIRSSELMDMLSVSLAAGRPLAGALSTLARYHFDPTTRHSLLFVCNEIKQGADPWESMADARLLTNAEAHAIESATTPESRAWSLQRLADNRREQLESKVESLGSLLQTALTLMVAALVLFVALAFLSPLFNMIENLT